MILKVLPTGMFGSNSYLIGDNGEGVVIDAGVDADEIIDEASKAGLKIKYIVLTHGHVDHIQSTGLLREKTGAQVLIHEAEGNYLTDPMLNASYFMGMSLNSGSADRLLNHGDIIEAGGLNFEVIHTPGHTPGGICIKVNNLVFSGDTLFRASIGRTDLPGGNHEELINSIKSRLLTFDEAIIVYPGHGSSTTIGYEKRSNPFLK